MLMQFNAMTYIPNLQNMEQAEYLSCPTTKECLKALLTMWGVHDPGDCENKLLKESLNYDYYLMEKGEFPQDQELSLPANL